MTQQLIDSADNSQPVKTPDRLPYRVVLVHPSAGVNWSGGAEIVTVELARRLCYYFDLELLSGAPCGPFSTPVGGIPHAYTARALRHPLIAPLWRGFTNIPEFWVEQLTSFLPCAIHLLRRPADAIFIHNESGGLAMAACVRALTRTPILYTEHGSLLLGGRFLRRNLTFRPDRVVVFHETVAAFIRTIRPNQAVSVIPNGVDVDRFTPEGACIDLGLARPIVLCVASLYRHGHKRIELAMQAVARLPKACLLVCGDGPDRAYFQALGDKLLGPERFNLRSFPFERMPEVYRSADVFTLPSIDEPFGLVYLEAMASGLPVVATDDEMRRYIIADGGVLCDVTDPVAYANAIAQVLNGNGTWKARARQNALRFNWDTLALRYRDVILEAIGHSQKD